MKSSKFLQFVIIVKFLLIYYIYAVKSSKLRIYSRLFLKDIWDCDAIKSFKLRYYDRLALITQTIIGIIVFEG